MLPLAASSLAVDDNSARGVVRRALVLSNGALGAEGQCLGLVRALGLHRGTRSKHGSGSNDVFDVRLVGDAALMMSRRLGAAWSERLSHSMGARELVKRGGPRQAPLPRYSEALAKALHRFVPSHGTSPRTRSGTASSVTTAYATGSGSAWNSRRWSAR